MLKSGTVVQRIGKTNFEVTRATDSKGRLRPDWFMTTRCAGREPIHFTGFASADLAAEYAKSFQPSNPKRQTT